MLCATGDFADSPKHPGTRSEEIRRIYLTSRVLSDHNRTYHLTHIIHETLSYIFQHQPELESQRMHFTLALCAATARRGASTCATIDSSLYRKQQSRGIILQRVLVAAVLLDIKLIIYTLIERGVKDSSTEYGTACEAAIYNGDLELLRDLLDKDTHFDRTGLSIYSLFMGAARNGNKEILRLLLCPKYLGTNISLYRHAIDGAVAGGHLDMIQDLIHTASIMGYEFPRNYYWSKSKVNPIINHILFRACLGGHEEIVGWALDQGADPRTIKRSGLHSALDRAALNGYEAIVRLLLETHKQRSAGGINNFWQRRCLNRSLVLAARRGWLGIAQLLIDHGAHVNPVAEGIFWCDDNNIPLISAVKCGGQVEMVSLLLRNGATTDYRLKKGECTIRELILSLALQHGYTSIQDIFKSE